MRTRMLFALCLILTAMAALAYTLKMPPPPEIDLKGATPYALTAGLFLPKEMKEYTYSLKLSPFDKMVYPLGEQTLGLFDKNLPKIFKNVVRAESPKPGQGTDLVIEPAIVKFESVVPRPAYNPYTATIVYRIIVYDRDGNKVFTQTATGNGQTGKGIVSGLSAQGLAAEAAQLAMVDSAKQILEALLAAPEIRDYK